MAFLINRIRIPSQNFDLFTIVHENNSTTPSNKIAAFDKESLSFFILLNVDLIIVTVRATFTLLKISFINEKIFLISFVLFEFTSVDRIKITRDMLKRRTSLSGNMSSLKLRQLTLLYYNQW